MAFRLATLKEWQYSVNTDPTATFFQTPAWHILSSAFCGSRPWPLLWQKKGQVALLPFSRRHHGPLAHFFSPNGTYSAPLSPEALQPKVLKDLARDLESQSLEWTGCPYSHNALCFEASQGRLASSHAFALDPGSAACEVGSKEMQRRYRRASEMGIVAHSSQSDGDWQDYYDLYRFTFHRWGTKARRLYSLPWFQSMKRQFEKRSGFEMWLARRPQANGISRNLAGLIVFRHGHIASAWQMVTGSGYEDKAGIPVVLHAAIQSARAAGCTVFDLGPSPNLPSVSRFKTGLGASEFSYQGLSHCTRFYQFCSALGKRLLCR